MDFLVHLAMTLLSTVIDVLPIISVLFGFQLLIIRQPLPHFKQIAIGLIYVVLGLALFLVGLEMALFPLGEVMAKQLTAPSFLYADGIAPAQIHWLDYIWVYAFAAAIGFSTTIAEPSLIAVAIKAREASGGSIGIWGLRIAVAIGVAFGVGLGAYRIVVGTPLPYFIVAGYVIVIVQTFFSDKTIVPLAYDSGGVTTSTVTVPLVAALGLGLASTIPGRSVLIDGFGLIAFASLFPIISVLGYAQITAYLKYRNATRTTDQAKVVTHGRSAP